jgi:cephalosporin-C deacetylase-like acetyl esterase
LAVTKKTGTRENGYRIIDAYVVVPKKASGTKRPVFVSFHGGGGVFGFPLDALAAASFDHIFSCQ